MDRDSAPGPDADARLGGPRQPIRGLRAALEEFLDREFRWSTGHLATALSGCAFAPSLLTFWLINGVLDFSTAVFVGAVGTPAGLLARLAAYVLLVPVFLAVRMGYYLLHPTHRRAVLSGACPDRRLLSLDWFSVGILATGLPLALREIGPWIGMNLVFLLGVFVLPRWLPRRRVVPVRLAAIALGTTLFVYAKYGGLLPGTPDPAAVLGPLVTLELADRTVERLLRIANSLLVGPVLVGAFALLMNRVLTRPELTGLPGVRYTLPRRDPWEIVVTSAALGTVFYLLVAAVVTGELVVVP